MYKMFNFILIQVLDLFNFNIFKAFYLMINNDNSNTFLCKYTHTYTYTHMNKIIKQITRCIDMLKI